MRFPNIAPAHRHVCIRSAIARTSLPRAILTRHMFRLLFSFNVSLLARTRSRFLNPILTHWLFLLILFCWLYEPCSQLSAFCNGIVSKFISHVPSASLTNNVIQQVSVRETCEKQALARLIDVLLIEGKYAIKFLSKILLQKLDFI